MDPATAMNQGTVKSTIQSIVKGVTVAVFMLAVIGGGAFYMLKNTATSTQASIDLRQAIMGTVGAVNYTSNTFTFTNTTSDDPKIKDTGITTWTIQLPPGASFTKESASGLSTCNTITSLEKNLNQALPVSCVNFLREGDKAIVQYLIVKSEDSTIITSKIVKEE